MMSRRSFLALSLGSLPVVIAACRGGDAVSAAAVPSGESFEVTKSQAEWRKILTPDQYEVLRRQATERPGSSSLNAEHRAGTFHCAGCDLALYDSSAKFESGTGWPSFTAPLPDAVRTSVD